MTLGHRDKADVLSDAKLNELQQAAIDEALTELESAESSRSGSGGSGLMRNEEPEVADVAHAEESEQHDEAAPKPAEELSQVPED